MYGQHCLSQGANCSRYWTGARANLSFMNFQRDGAKSHAKMRSIFRLRIGIGCGNGHGVGFGVFGLLPCPEGEGAQLCEIGLITLEGRGQRQVRFLNDVVAAGHVVGLVDGGGDDIVARKSAEAELERRRLIVGETEAVADAGALNGMVDELNAPIVGWIGHRDNACSHLQRLDDLASIGFHAVEFAGVLVEKEKKYQRAKNISVDGPARQTKRSKHQQSEDGSNES